jgi:hypothetical protein
MRQNSIVKFLAYFRGERRTVTIENLLFKKTIILFLNKSELICLLDYVNALDKLRYKRHLQEFVRAFAALLLIKR